MPSTERTFGRAIAMARKAKGLSQKELAAMILKEDGTAISPQYLNDIEHDKRSPPSDRLILQFARVLEEDDPGYLFVRAGRLPEEIRYTRASKAKVSELFANFRRELTKA
jgi:transcriptional regulator with XRE-family HTH domain